MFKKKFPSLSSLGSDGNTAFLRAARAGHLDKVLEHLKANIDINTSNTNGLNALHLASKDGHVDVVTELLKRGAVVDSATKKGNTALHIASLAGQEEVVKLLVANGASVNVQSQNGFTPLYMAAQENHDNVVRFLLANGANQSLATEDGFTPLAVAMQQGHDKVVAVLLENDTRGKVRLPALHIAAKKDDCKAAALLLQNDHNPDVTSKSGFTPLHIAAHYGNEGIGNLLLSRGADVNYSAKHNISPLHVAAKWGKTNLVSLLLEKGANIESKTRDGLTPLHCAARSGHEQVVDMLLERGAPISSKTKNGLAPLHMAAQGDHVDAARILLYHRAPVDEVTVDYLTALHVAAHCGHVRVAKLLLDRKADPNARALNGFTPLHIACKKNRIKVVELLLKHGASIEATTESGLTPLHVASFMGCMNIVIFLLQNDASPDVPTVRGETPLHLAARANQTDIIRILLRNGAQVDARAREQQTPLHIASRLGNVDIVMLLLQHGAAVDSTTKDMYTALHIAAKEGQEEVASVLLEHGASLTATTKKGFTPLHLAAKYGNIKVAKLLLQKDAPVDAQGKNGVTPLHVASHYDHQNVALLLLDKGASPHATAKNGHTPLHIAARKNQMDIATTLLEYGAKANAESKAGFTPLHLSAQEGHNDMSTLLIEHQADTNHKAKNGLTPLHLCAQEDRVNVAAILVKNGAQVDSTTKAGYTPLHVASHFGQVNMIRFLLQHGADVKATTTIGYTPLHQAAQQGHTTIVNLLLENSAPPNIQTNQGQTPLSIAQKLGYISVVETLKVVTEPTVPSTIAVADEKYRVVAPETMQETFMSDSEDEGGEETTLGDQPYRYLTVDEMKSLGDDSLPIDVTRDERMDSNREHMAPPQAVDDTISPQHVKESYAQYAANYTPDNVDLARHPVHVGFLVSFLVDARGGAMRGCRHSGVRVIVPPRKAAQPIRVTCRYLKRDKLTHPPPLMEGEALASRILELGPVGAKFLGPVIIEVPHFGSLRGMEREIVILRSDNGETWREHTMEASDEAVHEVLNESFEADEISALEEPSSGRTTRILTTDFPQYFAIVSRIRQEVHAIGPEGGMVSSTVVPQVQAVFPQGALTKKIKVGLQAQPIPAELAAKLLGNRVAVSPIVTVEPRRRKFHKPITLTIPVPQAANKGMINQYSGDAPTLRLLCSITGGTTRAQWEDVTGSTPLTFVNDCVSFTTTVSARFWLMDCRNIAEATKMATELYREAIHVPFMAKFVVFAKRVDVLEARLRVFCMTDDKEDKTLEHQEHFTEVAKSRDVEVLEGKPQFVEFSGNLVPVTKSGDQLQLGFRAFRENRLPFTVRVKDPHADTVGRIMFMREGRIAKGEPPQQPICILNIVLPENIVPETSIMEADLQALNKKYSFLRDGRLEAYQRTDLRLSDISNLLGEDWVPLAGELNITNSEVDLIRSECPDSSAQQAMAMLRLWMQQQGNKANARALQSALRKLGRDDIVQQCIFTVDPVDRAVGRVKLDQSGFDSLGPSRDTSLGRNISLDAAFDERDMMKESESVEELVLQEKVKPMERLKDGRRDSDETETKYIGEEKVVVEEQKSVSELKEIFAADKRDRQYERQPVIGAMGELVRPVSMIEQVVQRKISTSDDRPKSAVEIVEKTVETVKEDELEEEKSLSVEEIRKRFSAAEDKDEKTVTTTVTKVTKKISGIPVAAPKTPETTKKASGIPTLTQKTTEIQETITKTIDDGSKKTSEVKEVVTTTLEDGSKKVTETISQKTSGIPKLTQKIGEAQEVVKTVETKEIAPKVTETVTTQKISGIPVVSTKTVVIESVSPKPSEVISHTTQEVTVSTKSSGIPVVTKTTKVTETITKTLEDGKEVVTKTIDDKKQQIFEKVSADQRRDSELFQGVSEELGRLETTFKVAAVEDGILSPKVAKTPPPSPAEFSREQTGGQPAWTAGVPLATEHHPATQEWTGKAQGAEPEPPEGAKQLTSDTRGAPVESPVEVPPPRPLPRRPESPRHETSACLSPLEPVGHISSDVSPVAPSVHRVSVGVSPSEALKGVPEARRSRDSMEMEAEEKLMKATETEVEEERQDISVSDRKKFWEQMGSKDGSVDSAKQEPTAPLVPQPRVIVKDLGSHKDITKDFLDHEKEASTEDVFRKSESESETMSDSTIRMHVPAMLISKQSTGSSDTSDREGSEMEAMDTASSQGVPTTAMSAVAAITGQEEKISRTESSDSEAAFVAKYGKEQLSFDNTAYVSDDDGKHVVDYEDETFDELGDARGDQEKTIFRGPPVAATRKTIYERSVSLPTEDLIPSDQSASVRAKKRYFEAQIKKEMVVDQLMTQPEEESSPEHKSFEQVSKAPDSAKVMARQLSREMEDVVTGKGVSLKERADTLEFIRKESEARAREEAKIKVSDEDTQKPIAKERQEEEKPSSVKDLAKGFDKLTSVTTQIKSKVETSKDDKIITVESKSLTKESVSGISSAKVLEENFEEQTLKTSVKDRAKSIDVGVSRFGLFEEPETKMSVKDRAKSIDAGTIKLPTTKDDVRKLEDIKDGIEPEEDISTSLKEFARGFDTVKPKETIIKEVTKSVFEQKEDIQEEAIASVRDIRSVFESKEDMPLVVEERTITMHKTTTQPLAEEAVDEGQVSPIETKFDHDKTTKHIMSAVRSESKTESETSMDSQEGKVDLDLGSREELSHQVTEFMQYKMEGIGKPSDSLEVHVDKSETEQTEKDIDDDIKAMEKKTGSRRDSEEEEPIPEIVVTLSGKQRTDSGSVGESDTASESDVTPEEARGEEHPLYQSKQQFPDTVWEVPVQQQPESEAQEEVQEIAIEKQVIVEKEEPEDDYAQHEKMHISEEEARVLAEEVVEDIEDEVSRRAELMDIVPAPHPTIAQSQVAEYLRQLTGDDLEPGDIELVESILERKHQEQMRRLARKDTATSSMEITDEDLRSSGLETDLSPLESHMGKLPAGEDKTLSEDITELTHDIEEESGKMRGEVALEKTLAEVRESLEAAQEVLIEEHKMKEEVVQKKESPSEFEFKVLTFEKKIEECIEESHQEDYSISSDHGEATVEGDGISHVTDIAVKVKDSKKDESKTIEKGEIGYEDDGSEHVTDSVTKERVRRDLKSVEAKVEDVVQEAGDKDGDMSEKRLSVTISDEEDRSIHSTSSETETRTKDTLQTKKVDEEREDLIATSDEKMIYEDKSQEGDSIKESRKEVTSKSEEKAIKEATTESDFTKKVIGDPDSDFHVVEEHFKTVSSTTTIEKKGHVKQESTTSTITFSGDASSFEAMKSQLLSDMSQDSFSDSGISRMESKSEESKSSPVELKSTKMDTVASETTFDTMPTLTEGVELKDTFKIIKEEVKRTSSEDSQRSSQDESIKSPIEVVSDSSSSAGRRGDSETIRTFEAPVVIRRHTKHTKIDGDTSSSGSANLRADRRSGADFESSSGESHYHSFEQISDTRSRPCSSDVEGLLGIGTTGSSEYESALTSQEYSTRSATSHEYHTAVSSVSSRESMKSLDSESSGHLASNEVSSEASETLVPSALELERDMEGAVGSLVMDDEQVIEPYDTTIPVHVIRGEPPPASYQQDSFEGSQSDRVSPFEMVNEADVIDYPEDEAISEDDVDGEDGGLVVDSEDLDRPHCMKRSHEMIFQPEPHPMTDNLITDSPLSEDEKEEKFGSLEDGSILSVTGSYSSVSDVGNLRTVIELSRTDSERMDVSGTSEKHSMTLSGTSEQLSLEEVDAGTQQSQFVDSGTCTYPPSESTRELTLTSVTMMTSSIDDDGVQSVCTQVTSQCQTPVPDEFDDTITMLDESTTHNGPTRVEYVPEYDDFEDTRKKSSGHRRKESTSSFVPSVIPTLTSELEKIKQKAEKPEADEDVAESDKYTERAPLTLKEVRSDEKKDIDEAEREESYQTEADQGFHRDLREGRMSVEEAVEDDEIRELDMSRPQSQVSKSDSEGHRPMSSGFSDDRPDSELAELIKQCSTDGAGIEDPIERPSTPEPGDECEIKDDTPEFSSEAQASVTELEQEYRGAYSRTVEYASHVSPIREEKHGVRYDEACSIPTVEWGPPPSEYEDEMAEAEAAFQMAAHIYPTMPGVVPSTIPEDPAAEKHELETREKAVKEKKRRIEEELSPGSIPDITVTQHMTPLVDRAFHYPDLEAEEAEARSASASQTPLSSSCASSETDQGKEYILEEDEGLGEYISEEPEVEAMLEEKALHSQSTDVSAAEDKTVYETTKPVTEKADAKEKETGSGSPHSISPESDSFEMLEKPDLTDDYVVIEEVGKEAEEHDKEGKSVHIERKKRVVKKHDDEDLVSSPPAPATRMTDIKYYPEGTDDLGPFPFESDSPPTMTKKSVGVRAQGYGPVDDQEVYDQEVEAGKKWIEMQFQGDTAAAAAAGYAYEEYERGPLEDIKEEDTDFDHSSKVGSMGSYNQSVGSFGSVNKESYSSTPEYDVLAGKKFFTKSGEHDDVSMSSLQEFELLERQIALEQARKRSHGSQDSISSNNKRSYGSSGSKSGQGDDVSLSSLKDFEGLEAACIEAAKIESRAKEEESMLSEIEEGHESQVSESESCETMSAGFGKESVDSDDYEKRMFEIDEIIRQAQSNVERFVDKGKVHEEIGIDQTESVGRGESLEEVAKVPELDLDKPFVSPYGVTQGVSTKIMQYQGWREAGEDIMQTSSDSLDLKTQISVHASTDSLDQRTVAERSMTASADSLELQQALSTRGDIMTDSIEMAKDMTSRMISSDSLELGAASAALMTDSIEEEDTSVLHEAASVVSVHDQSSSSGREGDLSSSGKEDVSARESRMPERADYLLGSTDSLDPTSSTATHATYQYETDSVLSSSFTSGGSNTMVSSTDTLDPNGAVGGGIDAMELAVAAQSIWFDDGSGKPFVTEVIEPSDESDFSHTIMRTVEMPPEVRKVTFRGPDAERALRDYVDGFSPGEDVTETQEVDVDGNVHIKRVVQRRMVVRSEDVGEREMTAAEMEEFFRNAKKESEGTGESDYTHLLSSISGREGPTSSSSQVVTHQTYVTRHVTPSSQGEVLTSRHGIVTHSLTGDAPGEWAPRDTQAQEAASTRGADGTLMHGAAGSSSQTTTETRVVEGSDDTMQELLDKLAAEQRK